MSIKIEGYEILEKAGGTTDTTIWTARQISLDRNVSIWVMKARAAADPNLVNHFTTITRAISRLKHNNFPPVIDISKTEEGEPYIVFENADSTSITRIIKDNGVYSVGDALKIAKEVALALDAAWKQTGLVHRNLKPDNIRIYTDGNVKIFNFNSATIVQPGSNPLAFDDGMIVGTPNYAAPEQIDCLPSIDFHADMYGLGATLYQMLTGKAPFDEERDPMKILELQRSGHLSNPKAKNPNLSDDVVYLLARLMAKNPDDRYAWWLDVVEDIEHILAGRPLRMVPPNGVVRSTIDQMRLVAPIVAPITPDVEPVKQIITPIVPIVPVNNQPIGLTPYSETIRNPQEPAPAAPQMPSIAPIVPKAQKSASIKSNNAQSAPKNEIPKAGNKSKYLPTATKKNPLFVFFTLLLCLGIIVGSVFAAVNIIGPAYGKGKDKKAKIKAGAEEIVDTPQQTASVDAPSEEEFDYSQSEFQTFEVVENDVESAPVGASTASQPTGSSEQDEVSDENAREQLLLKAFTELQTKNIAEALPVIKSLFDTNSSKPGINRAELRAIYKILNAAIPEEEATGLTLVNQTQNSFKKITICGKTVEVKAYAYANGSLHCYVRKVGAKDSRKDVIPLSKATHQEMYEILKSSADNSQEMLITKALLAIRVNNHADFVRFTNDKRLKAIRPFAEFMK